MPNYTASVVKHPLSKNWQAVFYEYDVTKAKWVRKMQSTKTTARGKAEVVANLYQEVALRASGQVKDSTITREYVLGVVNTILRVSGHQPIEETRRWEEYATEFLALQQVKDRSLESYESHIRGFSRWLGKDSTMPLNQITGKLMQVWYLEMIDEGRKPKTVNNAVKFIQKLFDRAINEGFCVRNPAALIIRQYGDDYIREPFAMADIDQVLTYLENHVKTDWLTVALLGLCTGQRLQDCANSDLQKFRETEHGLVWANKQGKGGKDVDIPIVEPLASHLKRLLQEKKTGLLAPSLAGLESGGNNGLSMQFGEILDAAGVERETIEKEEDSKGQSWTNKTFHSFRHTCNSLLANAGISDDIRRKILGHGSTRMNLRYTHMEIKTLAEALKKAITGTLQAS